MNHDLVLKYDDVDLSRMHGCALIIQISFPWMRFGNRKSNLFKSLQISSNILQTSCQANTRSTKQCEVTTAITATRTTKPWKSTLYAHCSCCEGDSELLVLAMMCRRGGASSTTCNSSEVSLDPTLTNWPNVGTILLSRWHWYLSLKLVCWDSS